MINNTSPRNRNRAKRLGALATTLFSIMAFGAAAPGTASAVEYKITMGTCTAWYSGTDANVSVRLVGTKASTSWMTLNHSWYNDFERSAIDSYDRELPYLGIIRSIYVKRDSWGVSPNWCFDFARVESGSDAFDSDDGFFDLHDWVGTSERRVDNEYWYWLY